MGNTSKLELLLKANDISNPFTVAPGDVILIPDPINSEKKFLMASAVSKIREIVRKQYIDTTKATITNTGDTLQEYADREKTMLPPNYAKTGDKELMFKNGEIVLGPNITRATDKNVEIPLTKRLFIEKIKNIKNGK